MKVGDRIKLTEREKKRNKKIADDIKNWISKREMAYDTRIYFNGKCYHAIGDGKKWKTIPNMNPKDYTEYANEKTITMTFEGPLYGILNYNVGSKTWEDFHNLIEKHGMFAEQGHAWDLSLYKS